MSTSTNEQLRQLTEAWEEAQRQLAELRTQVELTHVLAEAKIRGDMLVDELRISYEKLGQAVFEAVEKGELKISPSLGPVVEALRRVSAEKKAHQQAILELLAEGNEVASRIPQKATNSEKTHLATRGKKG